MPAAKRASPTSALPNCLRQEKANKVARRSAAESAAERRPTLGTIQTNNASKKLMRMAAKVVSLMRMVQKSTPSSLRLLGLVALPRLTALIVCPVTAIAEPPQAPILDPQEDDEPLLRDNRQDV